jgi:arginyl-tRNA--protein-N-Asp/Glu arginylyltransferase
MILFFSKVRSFCVWSEGSKTANSYRAIEPAQPATEQYALYEQQVNDRDHSIQQYEHDTKANPWKYPFINENSRIPSISTGGAAMNAIIKTEVAVNKVGIIKTPNHPM